MENLRCLYEKHLGKIIAFRESFGNDDLEGPILMDPTLYFEQPVKLLIVGQDTLGWGCEYKDINAQLRIYREFNSGEKYYSSPFWNITRKTEEALGIARFSCAHTNLNKFDQNGRAPEGEVLLKLPQLDFLLKEEIKILKPDVCVFYTNRKYDDRIRALFDAIEFHDIEGLPKSHFCRLVHPDLPVRSFRTPHPKTIRIQGWETDFIDAIKKTL